MHITNNQSFNAFDAIPLGVFVLNKDYSIHFWNQCLESWTGIDRSAMIGKSIFDNYPHLKETKYFNRLETLFASGPPVVFSSQFHKFVIPVILDNGDQQIQHTTVTLLEDEDKILFSIQDVTDMTKRVSEYHSLKVQADAANKAKSEFLANMSHDIRTPLNAILGFSELLEYDIKDPAHRRQIEAISTSGKTLLSLINDLLDLSKIEAGKIELKKDPVSLKSLIREISFIFDHQAEEKSIEIITEISNDIPDYFLLDDLRLRQILLNLLGNAVKFTDSGYVKIKASTIQTRQQHDRYDLTISVEDTGKGIPQDQLDRIFAPFEQTKGQDHNKYGGTGLGLAICTRLAERMNGEVSVSSSIGSGSTFTLELKEIQGSSNEDILGNLFSELCPK